MAWECRAWECRADGLSESFSLDSFVPKPIGWCHEADAWLLCTLKDQAERGTGASPGWSRNGVARRSEDVCGTQRAAEHSEGAFALVVVVRRA